MTYKHFKKIMELCGVEVYPTNNFLHLWNGHLAVGWVSLDKSYWYDIDTYLIEDERTRRDVTDAIYELGNTPIKQRGDGI